MAKRKSNPATIGLNSPQVEGQGTTNHETGREKAPSSRNKQKQD